MKKLLLPLLALPLLSGCANESSWYYLKENETLSIYYGNEQHSINYYTIGVAYRTKVDNASFTIQVKKDNVIITYSGTGVAYCLTTYL